MAVRRIRINASWVKIALNNILIILGILFYKNWINCMKFIET